MTLRWHTCPFPMVEREVPRAGRILDLGCGHGLLALALATASPGRDVVGVDIDQDKLVLAGAAAATEPSLHNVSFRVTAGVDDLEGPYDAICLVDVLYLVGDDAKRALLADLSERLVPGGRLVVKEMADTPRWKYRLMHAEEVVATRVVHLTASTDGELAFTPPDTLARWMAEAGLQVRRPTVRHRSPYPHALLVGERPQSPTVTARGTGEMADTSSDASHRGSSTGTGG